MNRALDYANAKITSHHTSKTPLRLTHAELDALADEAITNYRLNMEADGATASSIGRNNFSCHDCVHASGCEHVYDLYNTDGDCLASK